MVSLFMFADERVGPEVLDLTQVQLSSVFSCLGTCVKLSNSPILSFRHHKGAGIQPIRGNALTTHLGPIKANGIQESQ